MISPELPGRASARITQMAGSAALKAAATIRSETGCLASRVTTSSVTGRVGYAWDRFLLYVKGGGAWERDDYAVLIGGFNLATVAETRGGWTLGLGGEYAFLDFITGFIEYDFYGMGTRTNTFATCTVAACGTAIFPVDIKENKQVLKVGLNFKFGPTPPLVGRY